MNNVFRPYPFLLGYTWTTAGYLLGFLGNLLIFGIFAVVEDSLKSGFDYWTYCYSLVCYGTWGVITVRRGKAKSDLESQFQNIFSDNEKDTFIEFYEAFTRPSLGELYAGCISLMAYLSLFVAVACIDAGFYIRAGIIGFFFLFSGRLVVRLDPERFIRKGAHSGKQDDIEQIALIDAVREKVRGAKKKDEPFNSSVL